PLQAHAQGLAIAGSNVVLHELGQTPLQLGLRPEHIRLAAASEAPAPALVETVEYFGADTIIGARIGNASLLVRAPG
ncbi:TOBE domain-containing protein, partial [Acinetobacter baumannii]